MNYPHNFLKLLETRGLVDNVEINEFLYPKLLLQDASKLPGAESAAEYISYTIKSNIPIFVHGDFDVDGIVSTSILFSSIYHDIGYKQIIPYIPNRVDEGYGLTDNSLSQILKIFQQSYPKENRKPLLITVDCGIKDKLLIDVKWNKYFDFIITDHHKFLMENDEISLPQTAKSVVHAKLPGSETYKEVCGAVTVYKVCELLFQKTNSEKTIRPKLDIKKYIPMIALATNCDVMPLINENRLIMKLGLDMIANFQEKNLVSEYSPMRAIFEIAKISAVDTHNISTYDLGFKIGPRINAAGRLGSALDAVRLFVSIDDAIIKRESDKLSKLNAQRQELTLKYLQDAESQISKYELLKNKGILIKGNNWEEGIIGLVAGKLCEKYNRPIIVLSIHGDDVVGSCRSNSNVDIVNILNQLANQLTRYGGHTQAAGLTMSLKKLDEFEKGFLSYVNNNVKDEDIALQDRYDLELEIGDLTNEFYQLIRLMEPFGYGNPLPIFKLSNVKISNVRTFGSNTNHLKFEIEQGDNMIGCICWNFGSLIGDQILKDHDEISLLVSLDWDKYWNKVQLIAKKVYLMDK